MLNLFTMTFIRGMEVRHSYAATITSGRRGVRAPVLCRKIISFAGRPHGSAMHLDQFVGAYVFSSYSAFSNRFVTSHRDRMN